MNIHSKSKSLESDLERQEKIKKQEVWHELVVKVIIWRDGTSGKGVVRKVEKIAPSEWGLYRKRLTAVNISGGKEKIQARLRDTWEKVKVNGGFL